VDSNLLAGPAHLLMRTGGRPPLAMMVLTCALLALLALSCADDGAGGCGALCSRTVSFVYAMPVAGQSFEISLSPQGATFACQLESGEATCTPDVGNYGLEFSREGLRLVSWSFAPSGELSIDVNVDGARITSQTFTYQPNAGDACSSSCPEDPRFQLEQSSR
jgi:hypothetical protein